MPWDLNSINQNFMANLPNIGGSFQAGQDEAVARQQAGVAYQQAQQDRQIALARAQELRQAQADAIKLQTPEAYARLAVLDPKSAEGTQKAFASLDANKRQDALRSFSTVHSYLDNGFKDKAKDFLRKRIDADRAAGQDVTEEEDLISAIDEDSDRAKGFVRGILWQLVPDDQKSALFKNVGEDARENAKLPGEIAKTVAEGDKARVEADMAPAVIATDIRGTESEIARRAAQTANELEQAKLGWAKLDLDADALATNTQLKLQELQAKAGELPATAYQAINAAVISEQQNQALATRAKALADGFAALPEGTGKGGLSRLNEWLKGAGGIQGGVTGLRNSYDQLINSQAVKNLPPGPASDKDIQLAKQGFPPSTAGKDYIVSFLRGMEKLQTAAAQADSRRANWIAANKSLGPSRTDIDVGGVRVPAGTTFGEFNGNAVKRGTAGQLPTRGYLEKYGR